MILLDIFFYYGFWVRIVKVLDRYKVYQGTKNLRGRFEKFTHQMKDGWGLATYENVLFGSDRTSTLYLINCQNFKVIE